MEAQSNTIIKGQLVNILHMERMLNLILSSINLSGYKTVNHSSLLIIPFTLFEREPTCKAASTALGLR